MENCRNLFFPEKNLIDLLFFFFLKFQVCFTYFLKMFTIKKMFIFLLLKYNLIPKNVIIDIIILDFNSYQNITQISTVLFGSEKCNLNEHLIVFFGPTHEPINYTQQKGSQLEAI